MLWASVVFSGLLWSRTVNFVDHTRDRIMALWILPTWMLRIISLALLLSSYLPLLLHATGDGNESETCAEDDVSSTTTTTSTTTSSSCEECQTNVTNRNNNHDKEEGRWPHPNCRIVLAPSELGGYGVFPLRRLRRGEAVLPGDLVIHVVDYPSESSTTSPVADGDKPLQEDMMLDEHWWSAEATGGMYEGQVRVAAHVPGIGMLAHHILAGGASSHNMLIPGVPRVDEAGLTRAEYPGSGAISHYHNWTFYVQAKEIEAGRELILVNATTIYSKNTKRRIQQQDQSTEMHEKTYPSSQRSVEWLRSNGWCLDNVRPIAISRYRHAGRGLVARRPLQEGSVVAPVPLLAIRKESLRIQRQRLDGTKWETDQLLINYCFGHQDSSILLYSYGPMVNLINHAGGKLANVKLRWVKEPDTNQDPFSQEKNLMMELVATKALEKGDEILLDYGSYWVEAWVNHLQQWNPVLGAEKYTPSYVMDDAVKVLRTEKELQYAPYPENVFTSCYYRYSDNKQEAERLQNKNSHNNDSVTAWTWKLTRGLFQPQNLRPCKVIDRDETDTKLEFTVQIMNRAGLPLAEKIPRVLIHLVSHVPRNAIVFSDRSYTTDQHLENAFRHPIGLGSLFPDGWKDLKA